MKKLFLMLLPLLAIACSGNEGKEQTTGNQELKVMSFNIRYDNPGDSLNNWKFRADRVADAILFYNADVVGTQEVLSNQLADLKERISDRYGMVGVGREDGKEQGEYAALWYKKDRFELCDSGNFWLSQTPEVAGSMGRSLRTHRILGRAPRQGIRKRTPCPQHSPRPCRAGGSSRRDHPDTRPRP